MKTQLGNRVKALLGNHGIEYNTDKSTYLNTALMLNQYFECEDGITLEHYEGVMYSVDDDDAEMNISDWSTDDKVISDLKQFLTDHDLQLIFSKDEVRLQDRKTGITIDKETVKWSSDSDIERCISDDDHEVYVFNHNFK